MRKKARVDQNHGAIVEALREMGWGVRSTAQLGNGFPDLIACKAGRLVLIEVKDGGKVPSKRKLTEDERETHGWFNDHGIDVILVTCIADLMILDRQARAQHEGTPDRNMYEKSAELLGKLSDGGV